MTWKYLLLAYPEDPVARAISDAWGTPEATGGHLDGVAIRRLVPGVALVRRPGLHIHDKELDGSLPSEFLEASTPVIFPSIHRSESARPSLTVHPIGNPGPNAEFGGRPAALVPTAPRLMADALRRVAEVPRPAEYAVSFEATHHGPYLRLPSFFVEIGTGGLEGPPATLVHEFSRLLPALVPDDHDRISLGIGGGHYAPHFTDLVLGRRFALGHILSRHAAKNLTPELGREAWRLTPEAEGVLYHRAEDARVFEKLELGPTLKDGDAAVRTSRRASVPNAGT